jgi:integrase/recombinase XerD
MREYETTLQKFKNYLIHLGYGKGSVCTLANGAKDFLEYHPTSTLRNFKQQHIQQFYQWLQIRPLKRGSGALSQSMINHYIHSLYVFFNYLEETGQIKYNPISVMKFKRGKRNTREPLTEQEIKQLFESTATEKEKALLHLFYSCGLRRSDGAALNIKDIHF